MSHGLARLMDLGRQRSACPLGSGWHGQRGFCQGQDQVESAGKELLSGLVSGPRARIPSGPIRVLILTMLTSVCVCVDMWTVMGLSLQVTSRTPALAIKVLSQEQRKHG